MKFLSCKLCKLSEKHAFFSYNLNMFNEKQEKKSLGYPKAHNLYNPSFEHDACGIGCITQIDGKKVILLSQMPY